VAALLSLAALSLACSSSPSGSPPTASGAPDGAAASGNGGSDANAGGVTAGSCAGSPVTWLDDGVMHCASLASGTLGYTTYRGVDGGEMTEADLEIVILQSNTSYIFSLIVGGPAPLGGDDYSCKCRISEPRGDQLRRGRDRRLLDHARELHRGSDTDAGRRRRRRRKRRDGTFSAVLNVTDGGAKVLSQGTFSLPVTTTNE
jgi:hypothetical protein